MLYNEEVEIFIGEPVNSFIKLTVMFTCDKSSSDDVEILAVGGNGCDAGFLLSMNNFEEELKKLCVEAVSE